MGCPHAANCACRCEECGGTKRVSMRDQIRSTVARSQLRENVIYRNTASRIEFIEALDYIDELVEALRERSTIHGVGWEGMD